MLSRAVTCCHVLSRDPPDKVVPDERPHGEEAGHGGGLVREDVHLHGVGAGDGEAGPRHAQPPRRVAQEREVRRRADQNQHVACLDTRGLVGASTGSFSMM